MCKNKRILMEFKRKLLETSNDNRFNDNRAKFATEMLKLLVGYTISSSQRNPR